MPDPFGRIKRNLTSELVEGATDGGVRKARPDTSNQMADATNGARRVWSHIEGGVNWNPEDGDKQGAVSGLVRH